MCAMTRSRRSASSSQRKREGSRSASRTSASKRGRKESGETRRGRSRRARSETTTPLTGSAGQEPHQPRTATWPPWRESMFQRAGTRRTVEEIGTSPRGVATTKSVMPWASGVTPVAIVVQMTGEEL